MDDQRSERERMLAGDFYISSDPAIVKLYTRAARLSALFNATSETEGDKRERILRELLGHFGDDAILRPPFYCDFGSNIHIGARSEVNFGLTALDRVRIDIGEDVLIGPNVQLYAATHPIDPQHRRDKLEYAEPISIADNVWLGGGVTVCPGVTIGENSVIGAASVVTKDLPANVVAVGNPARIMRRF